MPVFISYSHQDRAFADELAAQLVTHRVNVWLDRWELNVGDSLLSRVQDALTGASALLVILSETSVKSPWVVKETNSGLLRELEERQVLVLPILIEDCTIPVFLREKLYADFRTDFDQGLKTILESIARVTNPTTGRLRQAKYYTDWAFDWGTIDNNAFLRITTVENAVDQPYTVLSTATVIADQDATRAYFERERSDGTDAAHKKMIEIVAQATNDPEQLTFYLEDQFEQDREYRRTDDDGSYFVHVSARRLGEDTGRDVLYRSGQLFLQIFERVEDVLSRPSK